MLGRETGQPTGKIICFVSSVVVVNKQYPVDARTCKCTIDTKYKDTDCPEISLHDEAFQPHTVTSLDTFDDCQEYPDLGSRDRHGSFDEL